MLQMYHLPSSPNAAHSAQNNQAVTQHPIINMHPTTDQITHTQLLIPKGAPNLTPMFLPAGDQKQPSHQKPPNGPQSFMIPIPSFCTGLCTPDKDTLKSAGKAPGLHMQLAGQWETPEPKSKSCSAAGFSSSREPCRLQTNTSSNKI